MDNNGNNDFSNEKKEEKLDKLEIEAQNKEEEILKEKEEKKKK